MVISGNIKCCLLLMMFLLNEDEEFKNLGIYEVIDFNKYEISNYDKVRNTVTEIYLILQNSDAYYTAKLFSKI